MIKINLSKFIEEITGLALTIYIISTVAFENYQPTTWLASFTIYVFIIMGLAFIVIKKKIIFTYYNNIIILFGILLLLSLLWTKDYSFGSKTLYWYTTCGIIAFFVSNYIDSMEKYEKIINGCIIAGVTLSILLYSIYRFSIFKVAANSIYGLRLGGDVGNSNVIGLNLAFAICFALYSYFNSKRSLRKKVLLIIAIIIMTPLLLLSGSKKALFVLLVGVIYFFIINQEDKKILISKLKGILLATGLLYLIYRLLHNISAFWYISQRVNEMFLTFGRQEASLTDLTRLNMIKQSINEFSNAPLFGNGIAYSNTIFGTYSHNNYVEILMNNGIIGFIVYYSLYFISIFKAYRFARFDKSIAQFFLFILVVFLILDVGMVSYYSRYNQLILAATSSVLVRRIKK